MKSSRGLRLLKKWFASRPETVKATEARELGFPCRQSLDHILRGVRRPTLDQAIALEVRYDIPAGDWSPMTRKRKA